ncbi:MAG: hypothetical protein K6A38_04525 [Lachnospiraceae bacterium]|nr:hypothetical protein [Lachnospiraceae bacterium]
MSFKNYIYTNKKQSVYGIMATFFGILSTVTFLLCIYGSFKVAGDPSADYTDSAFFALIFMIAGFVLAVISFFESDRFFLFKVTGMLFNVTALISLSAIMYAGAIF